MKRLRHLARDVCRLSVEENSRGLATTQAVLILFAAKRSCMCALPVINSHNGHNGPALCHKKMSMWERFNRCLATH